MTLGVIGETKFFKKTKLTDRRKEKKEKNEKLETYSQVYP